MMNRSIFEFEEERFKWSLITFPEANAGTSLNHLKSEIKEIELSFGANAPDIMEMADAQMLLWDTARRCGITLTDLFKACEEKFEINKTRTWQKQKAHYHHVEDPL